MTTPCPPDDELLAAATDPLRMGEFSAARRKLPRLPATTRSAWCRSVRPALGDSRLESFVAYFTHRDHIGVDRTDDNRALRRLRRAGIRGAG